MQRVFDPQAIGLFLVGVVLMMVGQAVADSTDAVDDVIVVRSLEALAEYAAKDGVSVRLAPGIYRLDSDATSRQVELTRYKNGEPTGNVMVPGLLVFSGNGSHYDLTDTTIHLDTQLHRGFGNHKLYEVLVTGHRNTIEGLHVRDDGDDVPLHSAIMLFVLGDRNTIADAELYVHGSSPYGYGHLLGKGGPPNLVKPYKHSGLLVSGKNNRLLGCKVFMRAYGHGIVMQGAVDTWIQDCYVEGELRTTDEMLAETSGPAFDTGFKSIYPPGRILPGQIKALAEDGIRTYASGTFVPHRTERVTVVDCTIKNMRGGVCLGAEKGPSKIVGTTTIGHQERGFSIGTDGVIEKSRGDAMYGPLLTFLGRNAKNARVDLELIPTVSDYSVPRLLEINGTGHRIRLRNYEGQTRLIQTPIVFGESDWGDIHLFRKPETEPGQYSGATGCILRNETSMSIVFSDLTRDCTVVTDGDVLRDEGVGNRVQHRR